MNSYSALRNVCLQLLSLIFLGLTGCTTPPVSNLSRQLPEGYYKFDCPIVYKDGMVELTHKAGQVHVQLLEDFTGSFSLHLKRDGQMDIVDSEMSYPGQKRSFKGEGYLLEPGVASGQATTWLKSLGPLSRNHRKGLWVLRQATPSEIGAFTEKQEALELRKQRAREAGLDI